MRKFIIAVVILLAQTYSKAQSADQFSGFVLQGKDTLDLAKGLKNYEPIRFSWVNNTPQKLLKIEVHFGNGELPFAMKSYKIAKGQKLIVVDLQEFLALDTRDIESPRKREADVSRIVILCLMENSKYASFAIPFKIRE